MGLSKKDQAFVNEYFLCGMNATETARRLGYAHPNVQGPRLLVKVSIAEEIQRRLTERQMSADEVLARLTDMARADMRDFVKSFEIVGKTAIMVDLGKALEEGKTHLIKKIKYNAQGGLEIELHDAQAALEKVGRHYGLFRDVQEVTGSIGSYSMSKEEWQKAQQGRRKQAQEAIADFEDEPVDE